MRITLNDLKAVVANLDRLAHELDLLESNEHSDLAQGSITYGRAYRLHMVRDGSHGQNTHPLATSGTGFLGMTKAQAYDSLQMIVGTLWAVSAARHDSKMHAVQK